MAISTDKLDLVVIEKRNLLLCISMIFDIHDFYEMYFICMYATIAAFLLTFKVKVWGFFFPQPVKFSREFGLELKLYSSLWTKLLWNWKNIMPWPHQLEYAEKKKCSKWSRCLTNLRKKVIMRTILVSKETLQCWCVFLWGTKIQSS